MSLVSTSFAVVNPILLRPARRRSTSTQSVELSALLCQEDLDTAYAPQPSLPTTHASVPIWICALVKRERAGGRGGTAVARKERWRVWGRADVEEGTQPTA
uniref:Uncharacterized protein n=1 Tax=Oryza rufipogon TaxID=4529 RepID=A0A0E0R7R6_ORYRU